MSESDSESEGIRPRSKRTHRWSSSSSSDSSVTPCGSSHRRKKRVRLAEEVEETSSDSSPTLEKGFISETSSSSSDSPSMSDSDIEVHSRNRRRRRDFSRVVLDNQSSDDDVIEISPRTQIDSNASSASWELPSFDIVRSLLSPNPRPFYPVQNGDGRGDAQTAAASAAAAASSADENSDSGDEGRDKCAICLRSIKSQEVGSPEGCDHMFCLSCLSQWSKNCNRCPMDRQPFSIILVRDNKEGEVVRKLPVEERSLPVFVEDTTFCMICGGYDREDRMLLCDGCERGFHLECLNPPLDAVPEQEWFCPSCIAWDGVERRPRNAGSSNMQPTVHITRMTRSRANPGSSRNSHLRSSARIFSEIERSLRSMLDETALEPSYSSRLDAESPENQAGSSGTQASRPSTSTRTRRPKKKTVKRRKRKTTRRRYTIKKKKIFIENEDGTITEETISVRKQVVRRRRKKKIVKKKPRASSNRSRRPTPAATGRSVRGRLARTLGMVAPSTPGQLVPEVCSRARTAHASGVNISRAMAGIPTLHIFGPRNELTSFLSGSDDESGGVGGGEVGLLSRGVVGISTRPLERCKALEILRTAPRSRPIPQPCDAPSDLLSSILESQTIWHSKRSEITINNDGTVDVRPNNKVDVRNAAVERVATTAPMFPSAGSQPTGTRPADSPVSSGTSSAPSSSTSRPTNQLGGPRNDREGYANFFNTMPRGPTPFCRGGPPLRFRMPVRPQLRRIPLLQRRHPRTVSDEKDPDDDDVDSEKAEDDGEEPLKQSEEDIDLYSDIEPNTTDKDGDGDEPDRDVPALGPPPEPPAFLLNMTDVAPTSEKYDPAEPCDSDDENVGENVPVSEEVPKPPTPPAPVMCSSPAYSNDDECPVLSLYSSASVEYSRKDEDERARDLAESRQKLMENAAKTKSPLSSPKETVGTRLSFSVDCASSQEDDSQDSVSAKKAGNEAPDDDVDLKSPISSPRSPVESPTLESTANGPKLPGRSPPSSRSPTSDRVTLDRRSSPVSNPTSSPGGGLSPRSGSSPSPNRDNSEREMSPTEEKLTDQPRVTTGLEGLDVEEVSSEMEDQDFNDAGHLSSLSLSDLSNRSRRSPSLSKKKKRRKKRPKDKSKSGKCASEEGEIPSDKDKPKKSDKRNIADENKSDSDKKKKKRSKSVSPDRQVLSSQENKKNKSDFEWKKPSKKDKNYREGGKSKESSRNKDRKKSESPKRDKDKKKSKDRKKSDKEKKKELERYDVRKVVKNKEVKKKDAFGRDLPSKSLSLSRSPSRSRSRSKSRGRVRAAARRGSRSLSPSPARGFRRGRRRFRSHSRSPASRRTKKGQSSLDRDGRRSSRSGQRKSRSRRRSGSRSPRRSLKKPNRGRKSWSRSLSLSPARSPSPPRVGRVDYSPVRARRSPSPLRMRRSFSRSWSRGPSLARDPSLEKLTVVLTSKDKKKRKKRKEDRRIKKVEPKKKKIGNSKEVFASGDNVLVSVNFSRTSKGGNSQNVLPTISPVREVTRKKKRVGDENDKTVKRLKTSNAVTKTAVDAALATGASLKRKKLTRLTEEDAEVILSRKPVAVIDLDMSPYREQTPSPVNVVVVSDSGSGEEGKAPTPQRPRSPDIVVLPTPATSVPTAQYLLASSGPKTPPEPPLKFSISKPLQLRPIANPLADPDDGDEDPGDETNSRNENNDEQAVDAPHKGPNTPPGPRGPSTPARGPSTPPRGPSTPKTPPSPQTSPDAYDPFEPTKSRSPSPVAESGERGADSSMAADLSDQTRPTLVVTLDEASKHEDLSEKVKEDIPFDGGDNSDAITIKENVTIIVEPTDMAASQAVIHSKTTTVVKKITPQPIITTSNAGSSLPVFSLPSPKTPNRQQNAATGIQRLQHRLGSPVNKTTNSVKSTPEKRGSELLSTGNFKIRNAGKRNGPLQDATNETVDMDDSPYSPASSEGDDLFDPPPAPVSSAPAPVTPYKPKTKSTPVKATNKFELLFGSTGPNISPLKNGGKKPPKGSKSTIPKPAGGKAAKKAGKKGMPMKMDEDQLRILDEVPSSAVELQVKDKFLKKLNRQERVVDEVKTVLKPHYARKHITKEEYKEILRRAVPKICHSKSGEINPSKIQHLVEAYVRKYRHNKKKGTGGVQKPKLKKTTMFS